jgi:carbon storage regulator
MLAFLRGIGAGRSAKNLPGEVDFAAWANRFGTVVAQPEAIYPVSQHTRMHRMLVLSRKTDESIHIGSDIVVKVSSIAGNRVKLAIEAPRDVSIRRSELQEQQQPAGSRPESATAMPTGPTFNAWAHEISVATG